jgi:hypothetical protein
MNMGVHKPLQSEVELVRQSRQAFGPPPVPDAPPTPRDNRLKQMIYLLLAVGVGYVLTSFSAVLLWVLAAVAIGLIALATAVCIYAQNNSW